MGDDDGACEAALHGRRRRGEGDRWDGGGSWVSAGSTAAGSASAGTVSGGGSSATTSPLFSSASSLTDEEGDGDGATSSSLSSLTSSGSETVQMGAAGGGTPGPLYALSTMLDDLPALRTGLSKYYKGRSQSFTSLADVSCVEDLAKKTTPYIRRKKQTPRCYAEVLGAKNRLSKTIAKKAPRGKPPAYQGKGEMYRC